MQVPITVPKTTIEKDLELDLQSSLSSILDAEYKDTFLWQNMEIKTKPLSYTRFTKSALRTFEQQDYKLVLYGHKIKRRRKNCTVQFKFSKTHTT